METTVSIREMDDVSAANNIVAEVMSICIKDQIQNMNIVIGCTVAVSYTHLGRKMNVKEMEILCKKNVWSVKHLLFIWNRMNGWSAKYVIKKN